MTYLDPSHHILRHVGESKIDGDFIEPTVFRLKKDANTGQVEE